MEKHLLVTISDDPGALNGVRFIADFFSHPESLRLTFFYTASRPAEGDEVEEDQVVPLICGQGKDLILPHESLEKVRQLLCGRGFGEGSMDVKIVFRRYTKILDSILEGEKGLYDVVVLEPRGLSWLEEAFGGSVSRRVLEETAGAPLWICCDIDEARKNVLLCVDGSPSSLTMADHVGFMLQGERRHRVMLLIVTDPKDEAGAQAMAAMESAQAALMDNGFPEELVDAKVVSSGAVAQAIFSEAEEGNYAVVAMGRTGVGLGRSPGLFMGSASDYLYQHLRGAALWVCR